MNSNFLNKKTNREKNSSNSTKFSKKEKHSIKNKMEENLLGSKFRILNEKLYTISSEEAFEYFKNNPEDFEIYHKGFEIQASKWPINPNEILFKELKKDKYNNKVIADLGCGEALLAKKLSELPDSKRKIHSFDLVKINEFVTECDIKNVPLSNNSVDVATFCLSLMGVNFVEFIMEARRILKNKKGVLIVAEIMSRINSIQNFIALFVKMGFRLIKNLDIKNYFVVLVFRLDDKINKNVDLNKKNLKGLEILKPCLYKKR
jgi:ribosomal RNA-processing protein 8